MMHDMHGFTYATSLDLSMGYYHIPLDSSAADLCVIVLPFGKFRYLRLPQGITIAVDIFQEKMSNIMRDLNFVKVFLDDLLIVTKGRLQDHLHKLSVVLSRLRDAGLRIKVSKCKFCQKKVCYLGFVLTTEGIFPMPEKIEALQMIAPPKSLRELRAFIGLFNYYKSIFPKRAHTLEPLSEAMTPLKKFKWTPKMNIAFNDAKKIIAKETMLVFPDFSKPFRMETDASERQLGGFLYQDHGIIGFFSRKLNNAQRNYSIPGKELLSIVDMLRHWRSMVLGYKIHIKTDALNLITKHQKSARMLRWFLLLQ